MKGSFCRYFAHLDSCVVIISMKNSILNASQLSGKKFGTLIA